MPWINMSCPYLFKYWFTSMNQLIKELNKLKDEYNSDEVDEQIEKKKKINRRMLEYNVVDFVR